MSVIQIREVDLSLEKQIVVGAIVSDEFLRESSEIIKPYYFRNPCAKEVYTWCQEYYDEFKTAPGITIEKIYELKKPTLSDEDADFIGQLLVRANDEYERDGVFNVTYVLNKVEKYCDKRELETRAKNMLTFLEDGHIDEAKDELTKYMGVSRQVSGWFDPFEDVAEVFKPDHSDVLFKLPGYVGDLIGPVERGWLMSILAPFKRGKTWWMQLFALTGVRFGYNVAFASFEMKRKDHKERLYKNLMSTDGEGGPLIFPCLDCRMNQSNECDLPMRVNHVPLLDEAGNKPEFSPHLPYRVCTVCQGGEEYVPAHWFSVIDRPPFSFFGAKGAIQTYKKNFGDRLRIKVYPRFSASVSDVKKDLDSLEATEGFIPDIIIIDYLGIAKPEDARETGFNRADTIWKMAAGLSAERNAFVLTGSQANRGGLGKADQEQGDLADWIGQLAHVDIMGILNQTITEKRAGVMRFGLMVHRHKEFFEDQQALVLQNLRAGQPLLDTAEYV